MFHMQIVDTMNSDRLVENIRAYVSGMFRNEIRSGEIIVGWDNIKCEPVTEEQLRQEWDEYGPDLQEEYHDDDELYPSDDSLV